jgi:hypothetical protein
MFRETDGISRNLQHEEIAEIDAQPGSLTSSAVDVAL